MHHAGKHRRRMVALAKRRVDDNQLRFHTARRCCQNLSCASARSSIRHRARATAPRFVLSREATRRRAWVTHRGARCTMRCSRIRSRGSVRPPLVRRARDADASHDAQTPRVTPRTRRPIRPRESPCSAAVAGLRASAPTDPRSCSAASPHNGAAGVINYRGLARGVRRGDRPERRGARRVDRRRAREANFPPHASPGNERLRLACQVRVRGPCEVRKFARFWGQGDALAPPEESRDPSAAPATFGPFGRLEFALDPEAFAESSERGKSHARGRDDDDATVS